ncbi:MAG TPA: hypothetical protein PKG48_14985 [Bacteroidales bacterium]|mgnify:CR=1 FL=1|nr:hypothetical protein [Bacteroidales bacterium]
MTLLIFSRPANDLRKLWYNNKQIILGGLNMEDNNNDMEIMRQMIEKKKQQSASQTSVKRGPGESYNAAKQDKRKTKKTGLNTK